MLVSKAHDFGFVHIPKCAGSTIRHQLRAYDDFDGAFYRAQEIEGLGYVNGNHVPLDLLRSGFPEAYAALRAVRSYAVCRDPESRFASSVAQRLRDLDLSLDALSVDDVRREVHKVIDKIVSDDMTTYERYRLLIIFRPQSDFVSLGPERIVDVVVPMENIEVLFDAIERRHHLPIRRDTVFNPTVSYRMPGMAGPLERVKEVAKKLLPMRSYIALRDTALQVLTTRGTPVVEQAIAADREIRAFVAAHYARDFDLHRESLAEHSSPAA